MFQLRYYFKFALAFVGRFKGIIFLGFVAGILLFIVLKFLFPIYSSKKIERIGIVGRYTTDNLPDQVLLLISSGLTKVNQDGTVSPDLAQSWEYKEGGKTWIFHLKDNKYWHDGQKVTSKSLVFEFTDVIVNRPDNSTIVFQLKNPFVPFPVVVSKPTFKKGFIGTGEWKVTHVSLLGSYVQELDLVSGNKTRIFRFYPTEDSAKLAFKLGKVQILKSTKIIFRDPVQ
ncbi:hypothetical protein HY045_00685 [Candidatus Woesebacteria bacterium]|nr:hypothetical protein [Candidatus Woesebacteria bacterium]